MKNETPMTNLSPAAQAVLDAVDQVPRVLNCTQDHPLFAAAALRAAVEQVLPKMSPSRYLEDYEFGVWGAREYARNELLAIATELEALPND
jgi:hypothetical protein